MSRSAPAWHIRTPDHLSVCRNHMDWKLRSSYRTKETRVVATALTRKWSVKVGSESLLGHRGCNLRGLTALSEEKPPGFGGGKEREKGKKGN